jgi:hypothetical protein
MYDHKSLNSGKLSEGSINVREPIFHVLDLSTMPRKSIKMVEINLNEVSKESSPHSDPFQKEAPGVSESLSFLQLPDSTDEEPSPSKLYNLYVRTSEPKTTSKLKE